MLTLKPTLKILLVLSLSVLLIFASGCSEEVSISTTQLAEEIQTKTEFAPLSSLSGDKLMSYFGFGDDNLHRFTVLIGSSGDTADTVAVFETKTSEQRTEVITGINNYTSKLAASLKTTMEAEFNKVDARLLFQLDNTIVLVICSDTKSVEEYLAQLGATPVY